MTKSFLLPPRRVAVQIRHRKPAGYRIRLGERAGDSNSLNTLTGSVFAIVYNLPAPCFQSTAVSSENLGSVVAAVPPFGMRRLAARTLERSGPNTVGARALAAIFSLSGGHRRLISNLFRRLQAAGSPFLRSLVQYPQKSGRSGFYALSFAPIRLPSLLSAHESNVAKGSCHERQVSCKG